MLEFCKSNNITARGHNVLWDDDKFQAGWVQNLTGEDWRRAAINHVNSMVNWYRKDFIQWDVINENLHWEFFNNITNNGTQVFKLVHRLDPHPIPFLNEYNVVEDCSLVGKASPHRYLEKINQLRDGGYGCPLGIGLESHFDTILPMIPYVRHLVPYIKILSISKFTLSRIMCNFIHH